MREISLRIPVDIQKIALRKLLILDAVTKLETLLAIKANRLKKLKGERRGQYSLRINSQWRICFNWEGSEATQVEIVDYH